MVMIALSSFFGFYAIGLFVYGKRWDDLSWGQRLRCPFSVVMSMGLFVIVSPCLFAVKLSEDVNRDISRRNIQRALRRGKDYGNAKN